MKTITKSRKEKRGRMGKRRKEKTRGKKDEKERKKSLVMTRKWNNLNNLIHLNNH